MVLFLGLAAAALPAQATFYPHSPEVVDLERLYWLAGQAFPVAGFPVSEQSLADFAAALEQDEPDAAAGVQRYLARWPTSRGSWKSRSATASVSRATCGRAPPGWTSLTSTWTGSRSGS